MLNHRGVSTAAVAASVALTIAPFVCTGAELGAPTDSEKEEFLRTAEVVRRTDIGVGINNTKRVTLTRGGLSHDAHW